jgi:phosphate-selective porin OprO and OprP
MTCILLQLLLTLLIHQDVEPAAALAPSSDDLLRRIETLEKAAKKPAGPELPTVKWSGQFQLDSYWWAQDATSRGNVGDIQDGVAFRRARIAMFGEYGPSDYRIEMDYALSGRPSFLDVFAGIKGIPVIGMVRVGHFFEPFSLERYTANRFVTFLERSLTDTFAPARNTGVMLRNTFAEERGTWAIGVFRSDSDAFGDDTGDNFQSAITGRVTGLVYKEAEGTRYWHVGTAGSFRLTKDDSVRFRTQPEARLGATTPNVPYFVDTGNIAADWYQLYGLETLLNEKQFGLQVEYMLVPVHTLKNQMLTFHSWYITTTWLITGEHRPYRADNGTPIRIIPKSDFVRSEDGKLAFGPGAWELAFRVSQIDLNSAPVYGGKLTDFTVGLNWYLNPYLRASFNYIHTMPANTNRAPLARGHADAFAMRVGLEF